jgi:Holliday junction resolvasome RuvABC DNA-binding subunit
VYRNRSGLSGYAPLSPRRKIDFLATKIVTLCLAIQFSAYDAADRIPGIRKLTERRLVTKLAKRLNRYGQAEFATDADAYRPAVAKPAAAT